MSLINNIKERAKEKKKTIVLPEYMDERVLEAAKIVVNDGICNIIIIGKDVDIPGVKVIDPMSSHLTDSFINKLYELRKDKGMSLEEASRLIREDYMYFACMLVKEGMADGIVSGACHSTSNTLRPALQIIRTAKDVPLVSSFFLMEVPNCTYGDNGIFVFADCGLVQNPTSSELADISKCSADSFKLLCKKEPIVALLSHSTKGSAVDHPDIEKVLEAVKLAKERYSEYMIDGELQLDAAIIPEVAKAKDPDSEVAGRANVLIFPDLDAGNIGYKLVQRLAKAEAYGPITQGINRPVNDLSRGASVSDIVGVIVITALQAQ